MKLNPDAVRKILIFISNNLNFEDSDSDFPYQHQEMTNGQIVSNDYFDDFNKSEVSYALELLIYEGFVSTIGKPNIDSNGNMTFARINGLTLKGQELLNDIYNDTIWETTKKRAKQLGKVSLSAMASGAKALTSAFMVDPNAINNLVEGIKNMTILK